MKNACTRTCSNTSRGILLAIVAHCIARSSALQNVPYPLDPGVKWLVTYIPPSQTDLLLGDPIPRSMHSLRAASIQFAVLAPDVEAVNDEQSEENDIATKHHAEPSIEVGRRIPGIARPDV